MNRRDLLSLAIASALTTRAAHLGAAVPTPATPSSPTPPVARKQPKVITQLGRKRVNNYAWMKDPQWKTVWRDPSVLQPDIRKHLEAENRYADAMLEPTRRMSHAICSQIRNTIRVAKVE